MHTHPTHPLSKQTMPDTQRVLKLAFLRPGEHDPPFNHLVARLCKHRICHTELVFEDNMAFSIFAGQEAFFKPRTFSNPDYELVSLSVSPLEYNSAYSFCKQAMDHKIGFTDIGMVAAYVQPKSCPCVGTNSSLYTGCTFCSKIVTEALQFAGIPEVDHLTPCTTTPSCLYEAVKDSQRKLLCTVPYKSNQLKQWAVFYPSPTPVIRMV